MVGLWMCAACDAPSTKAQEGDETQSSKKGDDTDPAGSGKATRKKGKKAGNRKQGKQKSGDDDVLKVKLRFHLLRSDYDRINTSAKRGDVEKWLEGINTVWKVANIQFELDKVLVEEIDEGVDAFKNAVEKLVADKEKHGRGKYKPPRKLKKKKNDTRAAMLPKGSRIDRGIDIYVMHELFNAGGIWNCGARAVFFGEKRKDDANEEVLAHEIGHAFALGHVPCAKDANLMMVPCKDRTPDNPTLRAEQIATARRIAKTGRPRECKKGERSPHD
jgi:hypothetical protein